MTKRPYNRRTPDPERTALVDATKAKCEGCRLGWPLQGDMHGRELRHQTMNCMAVVERRAVRDFDKAKRKEARK